MSADEVVFDEHAMFDDDRCDFFQVIDHFGEKDFFFPAMMVIVGIVADKVDDIGKFFLIDFAAF